MFVWIHIPKTGGTSFAEIFKANFRSYLSITGPEGARDFLALPRLSISIHLNAAKNRPSVFEIDQEMKGTTRKRLRFDRTLYETARERNE